ncbi:MAG: hypothetical protein II212_00125 [Alistipes sp.]|nr:hypothetical protein [Alistipes sp.]
MELLGEHLLTPDDGGMLGANHSEGGVFAVLPAVVAILAGGESDVVGDDLELRGGAV